jgi:hypothetical protein
MRHELAHKAGIFLFLSVGEAIGLQAIHVISEKYMQLPRLPDCTYTSFSVTAASASAHVKFQARTAGTAKPVLRAFRTTAKPSVPSNHLRFDDP